MSEPGNFLARWSRRKRAAVRADAPADATSARTVAPDQKPQPAMLQSPSPETAAAPAQSADPPALTEEELAELPALDELTAESDMAVFLRAGVPQAMRNAALRRAWSLDPKIRDFVCEAREYAYDWNVPGDVPGYGPLPPGFDVKAFVGRLFGGSVAPPAEQRPVAGELPSAVRPVEKATPQGAVGVGARSSAPADPPSVGECRSAASIATAPDTANALSDARADEPAAARLESSSRRRHGGATPV